MTINLHLPAQPDTPIACDMRAAADTPQQRLSEYERLFAHALRRPERRDDAVIFAFADDPELRTWIADLAHREAACCPFIDYRIEARDDELVWTMSGTDDAFEAAIYPVLGALLYATFLQVPFTALREAFADRRFLLAALALNFRFRRAWSPIEVKSVE